MKFKHQDKVRILKGFHSGKIGEIMDSKGWYFKEYQVLYSWTSQDNEIWNTQCWIKEKNLCFAENHIKVIDLKKVGKNA